MTASAAAQTASKPEILDAEPTMASPSWWGADSTRHRTASYANAPGTFVKTMTAHAREYIDIDSAFATAVAAGEAGIGPEIFHAEPVTGILIAADHSTTSRTATLLDLTADEDIVRYGQLRVSVGKLVVGDVRTASVFDDIRSLLAATERFGTQLPAETAWMIRVLGDAEARIKADGVDFALRHGDANVSNLLIEAGTGRLRLVDWDCAALMDPLQDLGALLAEVAPFEDNAQHVFELLLGSWDRKLFARTNVYAAAEAVRWGLVGALVDSLDPGTHEYSKFSDWQLLRAKTRIASTRFDDHLAAL